MTSTEVSTRVVELRAERVPFVHATVVRAQVPTSAHAGDAAIVGEPTDGVVEGGCQGTLRLAVPMTRARAPTPRPGKRQGGQRRR